jgi:Mannosyltransferase (PIG-V)
MSRSMSGQSSPQTEESGPAIDAEDSLISRSAWASLSQSLSVMQWLQRRTQALGPVRWTIVVYLVSRAVLLVIALGTGWVRHESLSSELGRWDGTWYTQIASSGYPRHPPHVPSTLGFFPLYPLAIWLVVHVPGPPNSVVLAGVLVSMIGGLVATILVQQLATGWWGEQGGRRATVMFCFFPGSIVFSMAYAEGLLIPLAAACILALQKRRWILAGVLAGFATAIQPDALALVAACAVAAVLELRRDGWRDRRARRSLLAPLLSLTGIGAFAIFLWIWTGTPFATLHAQHDGWGQKVDLFALSTQWRWLTGELHHFHLTHPTLNVSPVAGLLGAVVLLIGVVLLFKRPARISAEAMAFTLSIGLLAVLSETLSPNARILITAFPAVLVFAYYCRHRRYHWLMGATGVLLVVMSVLTYGGHSLTP